MKPIRLDKLLGEMGAGTRSQIKERAKKGRIRVNGQTEKKADRKIDQDADLVEIDGKPVVYEAFEYYLMNKPSGVISATEDSRHTTVLDLLPQAKRKDLFPVGRLDIDTEGLLLITNDGALAHRLLSPKKHVDKVYLASLKGTLPTDAVSQVKEGLILEDGTKTLPADLEILHEEKGTCQIRLTLHEGKFHQVKRMAIALGCEVTYLKRLSMGPLTLDEGLKPGESRPLTLEERKKLMVEEDDHEQDISR